MNYRPMFLIVLGAVLLVLVGCSSVVSTPSGTPGSQSAPSASATAPTPTTPPGSQASATTTSAQVVHVTLTDSRINADHSTLYAGMPYHFVVTNTGQVTYQFMMGQGGWQSDHMPMGWQHQMTPYRSYQIAPGATTTFDYTFPASATGPRFGFGCYQQGGQEGMWYPFTVQPHP
jgi:uncharacterized cupredoxin-like copper-binding protein